MRLSQFGTAGTAYRICSLLVFYEILSSPIKDLAGFPAVRLCMQVPLHTVFASVLPCLAGRDGPGDRGKESQSRLPIKV